MLGTLTIGDTDLDDFNFTLQSRMKEQSVQKSEVAKDIFEMLTCSDNSDGDKKSPTTTLIEGAPGIGKTVLSKEIAFRWANSALLLKKVLTFLIFLIDPVVQNIVNLSDLIHYFYQFDTSCSDISKSCADYLIKSEGHDVFFILDGYDELPKKLSGRTLVLNLIQRRVLPESTIVITSRPHAVGHLRHNVDRRVIILGFTKEEQCGFVRCFLKNQPEKITVLLDYLQSHSTINSLCSIPFNINVLLCLYNQGYALPNNSTELYKHLLCNTIYCHLAKHNINCPKYFVDLNSIPEPFGKIIKSLAGFALTTLLDNKLTFIWKEIKEACPEIDEVPGTINGFGLLHAVESYSCNLLKSLTLRFIHLSVQEYLAAYHITCLQQKEELMTLNRLFYGDIQKSAVHDTLSYRREITHINVVKMYIGLSKGQRPAFKEILEDQQVQYYLSHNFFTCFLLHRTLYEANDIRSCNMINECFARSKRIVHCFKPPVPKPSIYDEFTYEQMPLLFYRKRYRAYSALLPNDIENLTQFLSHQIPDKVWRELCLDTSYIGDCGCQIIHHGLIPHVTLTIEEIDISNNSLTSQSANVIADIVIHCKTKKLCAMENRIGAEGFDRLLSSSSVLEELNWDHNHLPSTEAIILFKALRHCNHLKVLEISNNDIDVDAIEELSISLRENRTLRELWLTGNPITGQAALSLVQSLKENTSLHTLWLPSYSSKDIIDKIRTEERTINNYRNSKQSDIPLCIYLTGHRPYVYKNFTDHDLDDFI